MLYAGGLAIICAYVYVYSIKRATFRMFILLQALLIVTNFIDIIGLLLTSGKPYGLPYTNPILLFNDFLSGFFRAFLFQQLLVGAWILPQYPISNRIQKIIRILVYTYGFFALGEPLRHFLRQFGINLIPSLQAITLRAYIITPLLLAGVFAIARWIHGKRRLFHPLFSKGMEDLRVPGGMVVLILIMQIILIHRTDLALVREFQRLLWAGFFGWMGIWNIRLGIRLLGVQRVQNQTPSLPPLEKIFLQLSLSSRECEVCELVIQGLVLKEVGSRLGISANTARNHLASIFKKSGVTNRMELIHRILETDRYYHESLKENDQTTVVGVGPW